MMNKFLSASLFFFLVSLSALSAQTQEQWIKAGDKAFTGKDYYAAYKYYGIALEYDSSRMDLWYQYAESARNFNAYRQAENAYAYILDNPSMEASFPLTAFRLAQVKQKLQKYDEARDYYERFIDDRADSVVDDRFKREAEQALEDIAEAEQIMNERKDLEILHLGNQINSEYSEFGAVLKGNTLYYSSLRYIYENDTLNPPRTLVGMLTSTDGQAGMPIALTKTLNEQGKHVGHTAFNRDHTRVYYTICEYTDTTNVRCDLFRSQISEQGNWSEPMALSINQTDVDNTEPFVAYDPMTEETWLYFASDRTGGAGGMDIWRGPIQENGDVTEAYNLTDINTPQHEATPSWFAPTRTLYFSSDAQSYPKLGDFDIYETGPTDGGWSTPRNMGAPVNSSFSDLYYVRTEDNKYAYLASNRQIPEAIYWDNDGDACCFDIYRAEVDVLELLVLTYNKLTEEELAGTTVQLIEIMENGEERILNTVTNPNSNDFLFPLDRGKKYRVIGTKENYTEDFATIDTNAPEHEGKSRIEQKLYLLPPIDLLVLTFKTIDSTDLADATVTLFEVDDDNAESQVGTLTNPAANDFTFTVTRGKKYIIRGDRPGFYPTENAVDLTVAEVQNMTRLERRLYFPHELQVLVYSLPDSVPLTNATVELYTTPPGGSEIRLDSITNTTDNSFLYFLDLAKPYRVEASRPGYVPKDESYVFADEEIRASGGRIIRKIYLERKDPGEMTPLALYFDNDRPDPRTVRRTTDKTYIETNETYYGKRDLFIDEFTEGMSEEERFLTSGRFIDFFDREVLGGRQELEVFSDQLLSLLREGYGVNMLLQGYSSPRATSAYNEILSMRRISSVKNHFRTYENGAFLPYIRSGKLKFREEALGESTADLSSVSDILDDPKNSIYSISASVERRVDIKDVRFTNPDDYTSTNSK